jgi:hypothetical protein
MRALFFIAVFLFSLRLSATGIWVSPNGNDHGAGTKDDPMATVGAALRKARELRRLNDPSVTEGIHIILRGGEYGLSEPVFVRQEDSGVIIEAAPGEEPVLSGGVAVAGWKKVKGRSLWEADVPVAGGHFLSFRQMWVDGKKAVRARDIDKEDDMNRILAVDKKDQVMWIPAGGVAAKLAGKGAGKGAGAGLSGGEAVQLEMVIHQMWAIAVLRVKTIERVGDRLKLSFWEPESHIEFEHPWPAPVLNNAHKQNGNSAYFLTNAIELLDQPGEWYEDVQKGKVYYWPRAGEEMNTVKVVVPALTTLVRIEGTIDRPVSHIQWKGIGFSYSTWMRPSEQGHVPLQAGMFLLDAYKLKVPGTPDKKGLENQAWIGRPSGAVEVSYASDIRFNGCRWTHLASTGLDFLRGTNRDSVSRCLFQDIGGTGIQLGLYSDAGFETHLPYEPADPREVCHDEYITNNKVTDCTNEDWGCVGISAGYVHDIHIGHNEVSEVSYSGICVGWGWTRTVNCMRNNRIIGNAVHHYAKHMFDVGGIYTLSAQPGTLIAENYIDSIYHPVYAHDPKHWFYFYFDEGSSYITIRDNWCPEEKFMRNANGPGNTWENNGPMVADKIKQNAGIQK